MYATRKLSDFQLYVWCSHTREVQMNFMQIQAFHNRTIHIQDAADFMATATDDEEHQKKLKRFH